MKNRRGVSQIIGSLMILALVAAVGSVILFQGLNQINAFNHELTIHDTERNLALRENVLFEHVWFDITGKNVTLYLANIGTTDTDIATVTMVKIDTQQLILREEILAGGTIHLEDHIELNVTSADLSDWTDLGPQWGDEYYNNTDYKISISTSKGNFFDTVVKPPNT
jgi:hypothetical protein